MRSWVWRAALWGFVLVAPSGCTKSSDVVVSTAGKELGPAAIDSDPLALLPPGAVGVGVLHAKELFASEFGSTLLAITRQQLPLPPSAGFEPERDLERLYLGLYSMQGADLSGVAVGRFDPDRIEKASAGGHLTPLGPLTQSPYAGRTLYTAGSVGFVVLTNRTALLGNSTGIRRALDRIREGRVRRQLPSWAEPLFASTGAPIVFGADLRANPLPDAARGHLPFLKGVETVSVIGNFKEPGVNLAGTLRYGAEDQARDGSTELRAFQQKLKAYAPLLAALGIPQPVRSVNAQEKGKESSFVVELEAPAISQLLRRAQDFLGAPAPQPAAGAISQTMNP